MLAGGGDAAYRMLLANAHETYTRIEVWADGVRIDPYGDAGVPVAQSGNSISATLTSRVARVCSLTLNRNEFPTSPTDLLAPFGNYLKIFSGIRNWSGPDYVWPVFYGRINDVSMSDGGNATLTAIDLAGDVQDAYFGHPVQSQIHTTIGEMYRILVQGAIPAATFGSFDSNSLITTPNLVWENDRASACDSLATTGNMFWYPLANGDFVLRQVAWTVEQIPILTLRDSQGGILLNWSIGMSRTDVSNSIIVSGELADGSTPVHGTAQDINPSSPTYVYGKYGIKTQFVQVQGATTQGQATTLANAYLQQAKALTETWTAQIPADASIELGDCHFLLANVGPGKTRMSTPQTVSSFTMSLDGRDTMNIQYRAQVPAQQQLPTD